MIMRRTTQVAKTGFSVRRLSRVLPGRFARDCADRNPGAARAKNQRRLRRSVRLPQLHRQYLSRESHGPAPYWHEAPSIIKESPPAGRHELARDAVKADRGHGARCVSGPASPARAASTACSRLRFRCFAWAIDTCYVDAVMVAAATMHSDTASSGRGERRFVLHGVPWWTYVALRDAMEDHAGLKMTYLQGTLELMSPSMLHEDAKKIIARLIEVWAVERDVDLRGFGGATFRREAAERGLEPDECYKLGKLEEGGVPDIAVEVEVTSSLVDKMAVYAGLGVPEVWVWRAQTSAVSVYRLVEDRYEVRARSDVLPHLDVTELSLFVRPGESQTQLVKAYQAALRRT